MCYVLAVGAFCAVFTPVPARADIPPPPAVARAQPAAQTTAQLAAIPAGRAAGDSAPISLDLPEGRRGEALPDEAPRRTGSQTCGATLILTAYAPRADTEAKGSSDESSDAGNAEAGDTERK